jgi:hypothetical protein
MIEFEIPIDIMKVRISSESPDGMMELLEKTPELIEQAMDYIGTGVIPVSSGSSVQILQKELPESSAPRIPNPSDTTVEEAIMFLLDPEGWGEPPGKTSKEIDIELRRQGVPHSYSALRGLLSMMTNRGILSRDKAGRGYSHYLSRRGINDRNNLISVLGDT